MDKITNMTRSIFLKAIKKLAINSKWSTLSRIGNSNLVKLTIIAPFVGSLIIFNHNILYMFDLSSRFLSDINIEHNNHSISDYAIGKIYFIYFGLFFLGIGSIIYSIFCPEDISKFPFSDEYNRSRIGLNSPTLCVSSFENVAEAYAREGDSLPWSKSTLKHKLSYSDKLEQLTYALLMRIHGAFNWGDIYDSDTSLDAKDCSRNIDTSIDDEPNYGDASNGYTQMNGYINTTEMAKDIVSSPRVMWGITIPLKETSFEFQADVYHLKYMVDDLSAPYQRLACSSAYATGFILLLIPSLETFARVLGHVFNWN